MKAKKSTILFTGEGNEKDNSCWVRFSLQRESIGKCSNMMAKTLARHARLSFDEGVSARPGGITCMLH